MPPHTHTLSPRSAAGTACRPAAGDLQRASPARLRPCPVPVCPRRPMHRPQVAVVGAGVVGLSTALCLSQLGPPCTVTVVADKVTPHTTSDVAAGMLIPHTYPGERDSACG